MNFTVVPGCAASYAIPSSVNVPVSEAAANTVTSFAAAGAEAEADPDVVDAAGSPEPQPDRPASASATGRAVAHRDIRLNTKGAPYR